MSNAGAGLGQNFDPMAAYKNYTTNYMNAQHNLNQVSGLPDTSQSSSAADPAGIQSAY
jgi:hypothetical protein